MENWLCQWPDEATVTRREGARKITIVQANLQHPRVLVHRSELWETPSDALDPGAGQAARPLGNYPILGK